MLNLFLTPPVANRFIILTVLARTDKVSGMNDNLNLKP